MCIALLTLPFFQCIFIFHRSQLTEKKTPTAQCRDIKSTPEDTEISTSNLCCRVQSSELPFHVNNCTDVLPAFVSHSKKFSWKQPVWNSVLTILSKLWYLWGDGGEDGDKEFYTLVLHLRLLPWIYDLHSSKFWSRNISATVQLTNHCRQKKIITNQYFYTNKSKKNPDSVLTSIHNCYT